MTQLLRYTRHGYKFNFCFFERDADERRYALIFYIYARYSGAGSLRSSAKICVQKIKIMPVDSITISSGELISGLSRSPVVFVL